LKINWISKAINNICYHSLGKCNICGNFTVFLCSNISTARNNMICPFCGSSSRKRHVASLIIDKLFSKKISSITDIPNTNKDIQIYNMALNDSFSKYLKYYEHYYSSEYLPDVASGTQIRDKVYCQNVEQLSFDNDTFDLVISEDVFEHVRDYEKGFFEIYRILKPAGYHIFTIPCFFDRNTIIRVDTSGPEDVYLLPPEYHGDPIRRRILAYRTFGFDIFKTLKSYVFYTEIHFSKYADQKMGIFDSYVFVSKKRD